MKKTWYQIGISYVELIVVISIILILSGISVPVISNITPRYQLRGVSQELVAALHEAQNLATTTQNIHIISFASDYKSYSLIRKNNGSEEIIKKTVLPQGVVFSAINLNENKVSFIASGVPENAGTIILLNSKAQTITVEIMSSGQIKSY